MKRILAIDFGKKRFGFALSDSLGLTAQPFGVYQRLTVQKDIENIKSIVENYEVAKVIFGLPLNLNGTESEISGMCREFGALVRERIGIEVEFYDERMTTSIIERILTQEADISRQKRRKVRDTLAAVLILQSYLDSHPSRE